MVGCVNGCVFVSCLYVCWFDFVGGCFVCCCCIVLCGLILVCCGWRGFGLCVVVLVGLVCCFVNVFIERVCYVIFDYLYFGWCECVDVDCCCLYCVVGD